MIIFLNWSSDVLNMQFVQTNMAEQLNRKIIDSTGGYMKMEDIVNGTSFYTMLSCNKVLHDA
jgi:hypothetical protein